MREQLHFMLYFNKRMGRRCYLQNGVLRQYSSYWCSPTTTPANLYLSPRAYARLFLWVKSRFVVNTSNFNQAVFSEQSRPWWPWIMPFHASCSQVISYRCWPFTAPCFKTLAFFFSLVVILSSIGEIGWWGEDMAEKQIALYVSYMLSC